MPVSDENRARISKGVENLVNSGATDAQVRHYLESVENLERSKPEKPGWQTAGRLAFEMGGGMAGGGAGLLGANPVSFAVGTGIGAAGGGAWWDLLMQGTGQQEIPTPDEALGRVGTDLLINTGVPLGMSGAGKIAKGMMAPIRNKMAAAGSRQLLDDYAVMGVRPMAGGVTGNKNIQRLESGLTQSVTAGRVMQHAAEESLRGLAKAADKLAKKYGPVGTREEVGGILKKSTPEAVAQFRALSEKLYTGIDKVIGKQTPVSIQNTVDTFSTVLSNLGNTPKMSEMIDKSIWKIAEAMMADAHMFGGKLPYIALKSARTKVGGMMETPVIHSIGDTEAGQLKALYGALSKDMQSAAAAKGLSREMAAADDITKRIHTQDLPWLETIQRSKYDETAFKTLMSGAEEGGSRLRLMRRNMRPEEWDVVAGTVLSNLGKASPGAQSAVGDVFSVSTFLTNWNKLAPEAKQAVFGGSRYKALAPELDRLSRVAGSMKDVQNVANTSNTAGAQMAMQVILAPVAAGVSGGIKTGATTLVATTLPPWAIAHVITKPSFVRWLANGSKIAKETPKAVIAMKEAGEAARDFWGPKSYKIAAQSKRWGTHLARLFTMAEGDPIIGEYAKLLVGGTNQ